MINELVREDGSIVTDEKLIYEYLAEYFTNVGKVNSDKIPDPTNDPMRNVPVNEKVFSLEPATEDEIRKIILNLSSSTAPGSDEIPVAH